MTTDNDIITRVQQDEQVREAKRMVDDDRWGTDDLIATVVKATLAIKEQQERESNQAAWQALDEAAAEVGIDY